MSNKTMLQRVPKELLSNLKIRFPNEKTNTSRMRKLNQELTNVIYGIRKK